jgi:drug/metabolite transporter (DMT)-like permease
MASPDARKATGLGLLAVLLWSGLAALTAAVGAVPPFQLAAMTFAIGTVVGLGWSRLKGESLGVLARVPLASWCLGIYGLLAFHVCYFYALQAAPPLEASLIIYLWPLLIVLFAALLPAYAGGRSLKWWHIAGALLGLAGTMLILLGGTGRSIELGGAASGYVAAVAAALIWSSYSVLSRLLAAVSSTAVIGSCAATAIGAALLHFGLETTVLPTTIGAGLAIIALGIGPVGLAFYLWDEGMKRGDIRLLGVASYSTPLLSTLLLAVLGLGEATPIVWIAALFISAGALLASRDSLLRTKPVE